MSSGIWYEVLENQQQQQPNKQNQDNSNNKVSMSRRNYVQDDK